MNFKVLFLSIFFLLTSNISLFSQGDEYTDLLVFYVDEEYEKCLKKADKYMSKDESKNDPLPYLYTAMSLYEMSRDSKYTESYPNAYRNSINYLKNYRKKDKTFAYKKDSEPFIEKMKLVMAEEIDNYALDNTERSNRKIVSLLKKIERIDPNDAGCELMLGVYYAKTKNKTESKKYIANGKKRILAIGDSIAFGDLTKSQQLFFKESIIEYYLLKKDKFPAEAKEVLLKGKGFFTEQRDDCYIENKDDFMKVYQNVEG